MRHYLRASGWDFLLCLVLSASIGFVNCGAFFVNANLQFNPVALIALPIPFLLALFFAAYSRRTVIAGAVLVVALLVVGCIGAFALSGGATMFEDAEDNPVNFVVIMGLTTIVVFLMTRRRWLSRVFFVVAVVDICFVEFMYKQGYWYALVIALVAAGAMVVYRNYRSNLADTSVESVSFTSAFAVGAVYALCLVGVACAVFFALIAPLHPPAAEIKLFTRYMNYEQVEMTGVGDKSTTDDKDNTTNQTNEQLRQSGQQPKDEGEQEQEQEAQMNPLDALGLGALSDLAQDAAKALQDLFNFLLENPVFIPPFVLLVLAVLASPYAIKKLLRKRWYDKTCAMAPSACVERFYAFFLKRFRLLKVRKADSSTLQEFAADAGGALAEFAQNEQHVGFGELTEIYSRAAYGKLEPSEQELSMYRAFYAHFYKAFVQESGRFRYMLRFFRI